MKSRFVLRASTLAAAAVALFTLSSCDLILEMLHGPITKGDVQVLVGSTDLTGGGTADLGSATAGTTGQTTIVTIKNTGTKPLSLNYTDAVKLSNTADFQLVSTLDTTSIAEGADVTFSVQFAPQSVGTLTSTVTVNTSAGPVSFTASGTGGASGQMVLEYSTDQSTWNQIQPNDVIDYGNVYSGNPVHMYYRITNTDGADDLNLTSGPSVTTTTDAGDFTFSARASTPVPHGNGQTSFEIDENYTQNGIQDTETVRIVSSDGTTTDFAFSVTGYSSLG